MTVIIAEYREEDVNMCMPHLKGETRALALEDIEELFKSYLNEAGIEIMWQLLNENGWNIGGKRFIECGGW